MDSCKPISQAIEASNFKEFKNLLILDATQQTGEITYAVKDLRSLFQNINRKNHLEAISLFRFLIRKDPLSLYKGLRKDFDNINVGSALLECRNRPTFVLISNLLVWYEIIRQANPPCALSIILESPCFNKTVTRSLLRFAKLKFSFVEFKNYLEKFGHTRQSLRKLNTKLIQIDGVQLSRELNEALIELDVNDRAYGRVVDGEFYLRRIDFGRTKCFRHHLENNDITKKFNRAVNKINRFGIGSTLIFSARYGCFDVLKFMFDSGVEIGYVDAATKNNILHEIFGVENFIDFTRSGGMSLSDLITHFSEKKPLALYRALKEMNSEGLSPMDLLGASDHLQVKSLSNDLNVFITKISIETSLAESKDASDLNFKSKKISDVF